MNKTNINAALELLKRGREKLIIDFKNEEIMIYKSMFEYEEDQLLMDLSIEKYFTSYINYHFELLDNKESINYETNILLFLIKKNYNSIGKTKNPSKELFNFLIKEKIVLLSKIISASKQDNKKFGKLGYSYQKDSALFERLKKKLKKESKQYGDY